MKQTNDYRYSMGKAREAAAQGYHWIASLWVNRARLSGKVTRRQLRELQITQEARP